MNYNWVYFCSFRTIAIDMNMWSIIFAVFVFEIWDNICHKSMSFYRKNFFVHKKASVFTTYCLLWSHVSFNERKNVNYFQKKFFALKPNCWIFFILKLSYRIFFYSQKSFKIIFSDFARFENLTLNESFFRNKILINYFSNYSYTENSISFEIKNKELHSKNTKERIYKTKYIFYNIIKKI
jgi:hypothetical protein